MAKKGVNLEHVENTGVKLNKNTIWHYSWFFIVKSSAIEVSPNKRTLEIGEIWSKKGIFPLFLQFLYLKTFDKIPSKSPKPRTEIGFSDHDRQIWSIFGSFRGQVLNVWSKILKFYSKRATTSPILLKIGLFSQGFWPNKGNSDISLSVKFLNFDANKGKVPLFWLFPRNEGPYNYWLTAEQVFIRLLIKIPKVFFCLGPKKGVNLGGCKSGARL